MLLKIIASGSSGNAYILKTDTGTLLIECGVRFKEIQKGLNYDLSGVVGCLVTHFHQDHCKAAHDVIKAGIDIYTGAETIDTLSLTGHRVHAVTSKKQFSVGDFAVMPFPTEHDAEGSLGFLIQYRPTGYKLLFLTDSYYSKYRFPGLNAIMIECNYIKEILDANIEAGRVDEIMKRRLLESHFSLKHVKQFLRANDLSGCNLIVLIHLSEGNSDAARMVREVRELTGIDTVVAEPGLEVELELYPY